jgi:type I restriction enzyme M protein
MVKNQATQSFFTENAVEEFLLKHHYTPEIFGERYKKSIFFSDTEGVVLYTVLNTPFLVALKCVGSQLSKGKEVLQQFFSDNLSLNLGLLIEETNGVSYFKRKKDTSELDYLNGIETNKILPQSASFIYHKGISKDIHTRPLQKLGTQVENLFFEAHSAIRDIDGLHADEALDELCKVLYAKLFDEENTYVGEAYKMQRGLYGSAEECSATARQLYIEANAYDNRVYSLKIVGYRRSRGVFDKPIRLSTFALVKVIELLENNNLSDSDLDIKGRAFQKLYLPAMRSGMGQYFTPNNVVKFMVEAIQPKSLDLIIDPFSGSGHFLTSCLEYVRHKTNEHTDKQLAEFAFHKLHGIEKSERMVRIAMTDMRLHGDGHSNIRCTDALLNFNSYEDLQEGSFDIVITNPPFGSILGNDVMTQLGHFDLMANRKSLPLEIVGLERCVQFLRPNGKLIVVLPESILVNNNLEFVRDWLVKKLRLIAIVGLPTETFTPFGANIKTFILIAQKWQNGAVKKDNYNIFLAESENVGYDATGRPNEESDLGAILNNLFLFYKKERINYDNESA